MKNVSKMRHKSIILLNKRYIIMTLLCAMASLYFISPANVDGGFTISSYLVLLISILMLIQAPSLIVEILFKDRYILAYIYPVYLIFCLYSHRTTGITVINAFIFTTIPIIYLLLKKKKLTEEIDFISRINILYILSVATFTIIQLAKNPMLCRMLAGAGNWETLNTIELLMTAGFDFTYALVLIFPILFSQAISKKKMAYILIAIICGYMIFRALYTFALLMGMIGMLLVIYMPIIADKKNLLLLLFFVTVMIIISFNLDDILGAIQGIFGQSSQVGTNIGYLRLYLANDETVNTISRFSVYQVSIDTWLRNFWTGIGYDGTYNSFGMRGIGGHSTIFDMLAYYGMSGLICFVVTIFITAKKIYKMLPRKRYLFITSILLYSTELVVNPCYTLTICSTVFLIVPMMITYFYTVQE